MALIENLKTVALAHAAAADLPLKTLSSRIFNDGKKLDAIVAGDTDVTTARFDHAMQWFSDNWPDGAAWPEGVERPVPKPVSTE